MSQIAVTRDMSAGPPSRWFNRLLFDAFMITLGGVVVLGIIWLKSRTTENFLSDPLLLGYTFFVTLFQLSRVLSALLYRPSYSGSAHIPRWVQYRPSISFVIPCMNEEGAIYGTIENCFKAHYPESLIEVIVINDGSTDGTMTEIMRAKEDFPGLVIVDWKVNRGKRHGMAEGFRLAQGQIVIQLDSDSYIEPSTVEAFVRPFHNPEIGAISAHTDPLNPDTNLLTKMQTAYYFMSFRILKAAESTFHTVFCCSGCASAYRRSAVAPILDEWLNESFLGLPVTWGDDRALTNQVIKQGYRTLYSSEVQAYTIVPEKFRQFIKQQLRWKKGWLVNSIFASKFILKREPFVALTYFFPLMIVTILTPFMAARAFFYTPLAKDPSATVYYVLGVLFVTALMMVVYRIVARENRYWPYLFVWSAVNMLFLSYLLVIAVLTIQNRAWGTRAPAVAK